MSTTTTSVIEAHYAKSVRKATSRQLAAMINRALDCDTEIADVLERLAFDEATRRGVALPALWALSHM